ncbi:SDR family oxidoreductase [Radiobacillus sp. PE A8.2]|uniref:SDR family oxidoreductase n=1 Tax=Radiobacillus sp. PE A8.2 TaxID=3380349 RepID=UPI00388ECC30
MNILITGANRGLGLVLVKQGLELGNQIFAGVRNLYDPSVGHLHQLQKQYESKLDIIHLDVTDEKTVIEATKKLKNKNQHLDVIINNAGVLIERDKTIEELDVEACLRSLDINTLGPVRIIKYFMPLLEQGDKQSIINISSEAASFTNAYSGDYPYGLSKAALNMLSEKLHVYLNAKDIKVFSINPGWMKTDMGGDKAPTDPLDSAIGIYDIIFGKVKPDSRFVFINYNGEAMSI